MNMKQIVSGQRVTITSKQMHFDATFLGFSDNDSQYAASGPQFASWTAVKTEKKVATFKALEALDDSMPHGYSVYALFLCANTHNANRVFIMRAYLFEGKWSIGSGAEAMTLTERK